MERSEPFPQAEASREAARRLDMDVLVGYILLGGVLLSLAFVTAGLLWRWINTGGLSFDYRLSGMNLFQLVMEEGRLVGHGALRPRVLLSSGIAVLMLTPYLRVVVSVVYFLGVARNWKYTLFTLVVLIVLTYSLFLR
jgi:uncharacterized membrane protein